MSFHAIKSNKALTEIYCLVFSMSPAKTFQPNHSLCSVQQEPYYHIIVLCCATDHLVYDWPGHKVCKWKAALESLYSVIETMMGANMMHSDGKEQSQ